MRRRRVVCVYRVSRFALITVVCNLMIMGDKNLEEIYAWGLKGLSPPLRGSPARTLLHLTH